MPAGLPVDDSEHLVDVGLVEPGAELLEDGQCRFGIATRFLEPLPRDMNFGVVEETEALEMEVAQAPADVETLPEVAIGIFPEPLIGVDHAEIVIGDRAAPILAEALECRERPPVVQQGVVVVSANVREYAEVLLDAPAELRAGAAESQGLEISGARFLQRSALEGEVCQRVQRLAGQHVVADLRGDRVASLAELPRGLPLTAMMVLYGEPAQRLGLRPAVQETLAFRDGRSVCLQRIGYRARVLEIDRLRQKLRRAVGLTIRGRPRGGFRSGLPAHRPLTMRRRTSRSAGLSR